MDTPSDIMNPIDPRDSFMFMLLERIGVLETRVHELEASQKHLQEALILKPVVASNIQAIGIDHTMCSFMINIPNKVNHDANTLETQDTLKADAETILNLLLSSFGESCFLSATAILIDSVCEIMINFRKRMWKHEMMRAISNLQFPRKIEITDEMIARYSSYINIGKHGLYYSMYDLDGCLSSSPAWKEWNETFAVVSTNVNVI